ncbi:MAG: pyridoxal 5'-phosphate synthase glutaminase subunit PdxT [Actinobacteria bacterium]|nr:pyridoxal 5'-phosphate synthase glutaminase subunit PdxT [Actinomycetota bacterium]
MTAVKVGVIALQGATRPHLEALHALGAHALEIRTPEDLAGVEAAVLPGGESTTMSFLLDSSGLREPLHDRIVNGMPVLGTCAGMILLADKVLDGRDDQRSLGVIDITVRRNGFGRQRESFEADLLVEGLGGEPFRAVFIRAPVVERAGSDVEVLARVEGIPVVCRSGKTTVCSFHPELGDDLRLHAMFLESVR